MFSKEIFAQRVKTALHEKGQTQRALAAAIHCEAGTLSKYLKPSDSLLPKLDTLCEMSSFLGVSTDWLLGKSDSRRPGDIISARDICKSIMQFRSLPAVNIQTTTIQQHEVCNYGEYEGTEETDNTYHAFYFSDFFKCVDDDPSWYDGNRCAIAQSINQFIRGYQHGTEAYEAGIYTKETYAAIINDLLRQVSDDPLPRSTEINSTGAV